MPSPAPACALAWDGAAAGSGDFAETFAAWQTGAQYFKGQLAPPPTAAQLASLEPFFYA